MRGRFSGVPSRSQKPRGGGLKTTAAGGSGSCTPRMGTQGVLANFLRGAFVLKLLYVDFALGSVFSDSTFGDFDFFFVDLAIFDRWVGAR